MVISTNVISALLRSAQRSIGGMVRDSQSLVRVYERWLRTGSTRLAGELGMHGIVLSRGGSS